MCFRRSEYSRETGFSFQPRSAEQGKSHAEWLRELKGCVNIEENTDHDHQGPTVEGAAVNGEDPGEPPPEPDDEGEAKLDQIKAELGGHLQEDDVREMSALVQRAMGR